MYGQNIRVEYCCLVRGRRKESLVHTVHSIVTCILLFYTNITALLQSALLHSRQSVNIKGEDWVSHVLQRLMMYLNKVNTGGGCGGLRRCTVSSTHAHCLPRGFQGELSAVVLRSFFTSRLYKLRVIMSEPSERSSPRTASEERDQDGDELSRARPSSESPSMTAIL